VVGQNPQQFLINELGVSDSHTGELHLVVANSLALPLERDSARLRAQPETPFLWAFDAQGQVVMVEDMEEKGLQARLHQSLVFNFIEGVPASEVRLENLHFGPSSEKGILEVSIPSGETFELLLIPFQFQYVDGEFSLEVSEDRSVRLPSDLLHWELHPITGLIHVLREGNILEIHNPRTRAGAESHVMTQTFEEIPYQFMSFSFYHDTEVRREQGEDGKVRDIAVGPFRLLVQARDPNEGRMRVIWMKQGSQ
jgi:hypothetical protein